MRESSRQAGSIEGLLEPNSFPPSRTCICVPGPCRPAIPVARARKYDVSGFVAAREPLLRAVRQSVPHLRSSGWRPSGGDPLRRSEEPSGRYIGPASSSNLRSATRSPSLVKGFVARGRSGPAEPGRIPLPPRREPNCGPLRSASAVAETSARISIFSASVIWISAGAFRVAVERLAATCFSSWRSTAESIPSFCAISCASSSRTMRLGTR